MDYVKCSNCDFEGEVIDGEETCPNCSKIGSLQWTYSACCNSEILIENAEWYCSKCMERLL